MMDALRARYLDAQIKGDRREALRLIKEEGLAKGVGATTLLREVVQAAQRQVGELWVENRISIAEEHMATAISQLALALLYDHAQPKPRNGKRVVLACVEGELHDMPARLAADELDLAGYDVRFLGANVPTEHLIRVLLQDPPHILALSTTMSFNLDAQRDAIERVKAALPSVQIVTGGRATGADLKELLA